MTKSLPIDQSYVSQKWHAQHYLLPGDLFANRSPYLITTILGTCVSVCLWDPVLKIGGMNHYILPYYKSHSLSSFSYGSSAIPKLIERMQAMGCNPNHLYAKLFGAKGYNTHKEGKWRIGKQNIEVAETLLQSEGIPVVATNLGGPVGRKIIFDTQNGKVLLQHL